MDGGFLATCSCSHFMTYELFTETIGQEARNVHKRLQYQFGTEYGITIESKEGEYTTMSIHIPNYPLEQRQA